MDAVRSLSGRDGAPRGGPASWTRRRIGRLGGSLAGAALLAACGTGQLAGGGQSETKSRQPVTLRSWIFQPGVPEPNEATQAAFAAIKEKYPWITVEDEGKGAANQAYVDAVIAATVAGSLPDMLYAQGPQIQGFIRNGVARALDDFIARDKAFDVKDFPEVSLKVYQANGKQYAFPYDHGPHLLWYNRDLFQREGVKLPDSSWTMDDFAEAARKLTKPNGEQWGMAGFNPGGYPMQGTYLGGWGARYLNDEETEISVDSKEAIQALEFWVDLRLRRHYSPLPADVTGIQGGEDQLWWDGKVAMRQSGPWFYRSVINKKPSFVADIADWPKGPKTRQTASMGSGYPISSQSKHAEEAWLWLSEYLGKDENRSILSQFVKTGYGTPVRYSLLARWEKSQFAPPSAKVVAPALKDYAVVGRPITPIAGDLNKLVSDAMNAVWNGQLSVSQAAQQIKQLAQPLLEQNKRK